MICPYCDSPFTRIEPNTANYTCHACHRTFGYVVGSRDQCPRCNSTEISRADDYRRCENDDCRFTTCVGHDRIDDATDGYVHHPACGTRFQFRSGEPVRCSNCHPLGQLHPFEPTGCAFTDEVDTVTHFPLSVMFPERDRSEFFRNRTFDL